MGDGGKGSSPRPFSDIKQFEENFKSIFCESKLEKRLREERERLDNTGTNKNEYYDTLSTEDCLVNEPRLD